MRLVEWRALAALMRLPQTYWVVFEVPRDAATSRRSLLLSPRMNLGRLRGDQFTAYTRPGANMTLARRVPGLGVLKALVVAIDALSLACPIACAHVCLTRYNIDTRHGTMSFDRLRCAFSSLIWLWGAPFLEDASDE
jgi:hypothetical protein